MNKIEKFLQNLTPKEYKLITVAVEFVRAGKWMGLDIKKLQGEIDVYRMRLGRFRIIFKKHNTWVEILDIARRSEKTYRKY